MQYGIRTVSKIDLTKINLIYNIILTIYIFFEFYDIFLTINSVKIYLRFFKKQYTGIESDISVIHFEKYIFFL